MSSTPRLKSAFPQTPKTNEKTGDRAGGHPKENQIPIKLAAQDENRPLIPFDVIDAPSQRLYVVAFYFALNAWRLYEYWVSSDELDSTWLFLKWLSIDGVFLFALPALRIPWLEWAFSTTLALFLIHAVANAFLMFHIPIPLGVWASALVRVAYDRELSISERRVKPADILHNSSLILGKQIIHILPEGSAVLNPDNTPLCLDSEHTPVNLPIRINQTNPSQIELLRLDLDTGANETISISSKQLKQMKKQADKNFGTSDPNSSRDLMFPVKKTGVYQLQKVIDQSKLEVQRRSLQSLVVACPKAHIRPSQPHKCKGELSDLVLEVEGIPPLKIKYSRRINQVDHSFSFQSIQPEQIQSPLIGDPNSSSPVNPGVQDVTWAQTRKIGVPLNESLNTSGEWIYAIEEVHDAWGNVANYSLEPSEPDRRSSKLDLPQHRHFSVHERPRISFSGCNSQSFLEVAKEDSIELPIHFHPMGRSPGEDAPYSLSYSFEAQSPDNSPPIPKEIRDAAMKSIDHPPRVKDPGWYTLTGISSQFCTGEVFEPASCFLHNPPEPRLAIRSEKLFDKCANNAIGLLVNLDLIGTPPFRIRYTIENSHGVQSRVHIVDSLRGQLDLTPSEAGHYRYKFLDMSDNVYEPRSLKDQVPLLEQDVKPPASARFVGPKVTRKSCFGEPVSVDVSFLGESPWELQYELVHNGKRAKHEIRSQEETATLVTENLLNGGEYILALTGVKDKSNCKRPLEENIKIEVRPRRPQASFGQVDKKRSILALEDRKIELPLRLEGEAPWKVRFHNLDRPSLPDFEKTLLDENSLVKVGEQGRYEIVAVEDASCSGSIDQSANIFNVSWIPRPSIVSVDGVELKSMDVYTKSEVCEGDEDGLEVRFAGTPPYTVKYEHRNLNAGPNALSVKTFTAPLNSALVQMDTSKPGECSYKFTELGDNLYNHDGRKYTPLVVNQKVNPRPFAHFASPGHIYGFCKEESSGEEVIPINLEGVPPFSLEISVKHHSSSKPEIVSIPNINSNKHNLPIPRRHLGLGQHVISIHKVRDSRGCQRTIENDISSVRIAVSDVPTIIPLESQVDYCVGERISYSLSGQAPFEVFYTFDGMKRKATSRTTNFRRIAEAPGEFTITGVSDAASGKCEAHKNITKIIHEMPSVKISKGLVSVVDIHEGGEAEIQFEFWGTPPFEFTYTRSSNPTKSRKSQVLDTKHDISYEHTKSVRASDEGVYEVVSIKDKYCSFSTQRPQKNPHGSG